MKTGVEVRFFAAARAAAGVDTAHFAPDTFEAIIAQATQANPTLAHIVGQCSFLLDSVAVHDLSVEVNEGSVIDVLPRFAGG